MDMISNFSSAYCFISFILGAMFMLTMLCIAAMGKVQEPMNKVHFYVARDIDGILFLYMGKPIRATSEFLPSYYGRLINSARHFSKYGLNGRDFDNLKWEDETLEVFSTLKDGIGLFFKIKVCN